MENIQRALYQTLSVLSRAIESRDLYTAQHQTRVAAIARSIGQSLGMNADEVDFLRVAATLHDIGKIAIPIEILTMPAVLSTEQYSLVKTHSRVGANILKDVRFPWPVAEVVLQHHERIDGTGYPQGLRGDDILIQARIVAVADTADSMLSHRPYRAALAKEMLLETLAAGRGTLFDPAVVDAGIRIVEREPSAAAHGGTAAKRPHP